MRLTKSTVKRLIKEEISTLMREQEEPSERGKLKHQLAAIDRAVTRTAKRSSAAPHDDDDLQLQIVNKLNRLMAHRKEILDHLKQMPPEEKTTPPPTLPSAMPPEEETTRSSLPPETADWDIDTLVRRRKELRRGRRGRQPRFARGHEHMKDYLGSGTGSKEDFDSFYAELKRAGIEITRDYNYGPSHERALRKLNKIKHKKKMQQLTTPGAFDPSGEP